MGDGVQSNKLRKLRAEAGMSRREFAEYFGIPYRTLQDWELENRVMPEYLFRLIVYKLRIEGKCAEFGNAINVGSDPIKGK